MLKGEVHSFYITKWNCKYIKSFEQVAPEHSLYLPLVKTTDSLIPSKHHLLSHFWSANIEMAYSGKAGMIKYFNSFPRSYNEWGQML